MTTRLKPEERARLEESCKSLDEYRDLATRIKADGDDEAARAVYAKAERYLTDVASRVDYAAGAKRIFDDAGLAAGILRGIEGDCQFPAEFIALARGYKAVLDDDSRVGELLEQGAEFAMTGEEHLDLASGYLELRGDREAAAASYRAALPELSDRQRLLDVARSIANDLGDRDLAREVYAKAESRIANAGDLVKLALGALDELGDEALAGEIFERAEEKMSNTADFINLAGHLVERLGDAARAAAAYRKGLDGTGDYATLSTLLDAVAAKLPKSDLVAETLAKMEGAAATAAELLRLNERTIELTRDRESGRRLLLAAENRVAGLNEMRAVAEAVARDYRDDDEWNRRLAVKLEKREANQTLYAEFQAREKQCVSPKQVMALAAEVMEKLDDAFYARKLLAGVEQAFAGGDIDFSLYRKLIDAVDRGIGDGEWAARLLDAAATEVTDFSGVKQLVDAARALRDQRTGRALAAKYLDACIEALPSPAKAPESIRAARLRLDALGDAAGALALIARAAQSASSHLDLATLGRLALDAGDRAMSDELFDKALASCAGESLRLAQLVRRLRGYGIDDAAVRALYEKGGAAAHGLERLRWAEGILDLFGDREWARRAYDETEGALDDAALPAYRASRRHRLEGRL